MNTTLLEQYLHATTTNRQYTRNRDRWQYLLEAYMGGEEWQRGLHLTKYVNETAQEYTARLRATPLENHCKSVISTYTSFLFRQPCDRDLGTIVADPIVEDFLEDADMDGRSFNNFMKEVSTWSSVFGHCWVLVVKPNVGAITLGDELQQGVRPYVNLITPLLVTDWNWSRLANGRYYLDYFKYIEDANDSTSTVKEWTKTEIHTWVIDHENRTVIEHTVEPNGLGEIPAICAYNQKSPVRGIGISDITDIADAQRFIYNMTSEVEQSVRINGHPALVKTPGTEASAGAGAVIHMEDNLDPGLKPYMLTVSTDVNSIFTAIQHYSEIIDKISNTGSIRSTSANRMSGVAQEQEFQLLNARLSEKADNLELTEEQIWQWICYYQGRSWDGEIKYPDNYNINDDLADIEKLVKAKQAATDPTVIKKIDGEILEWLGYEKELLPYEDITPEVGRVYPTGEPIPETLPPLYIDSEDPEVPPGQQCANCEYYKSTERYCIKFDAPVRPTYWCGKWKPTH